MKRLILISILLLLAACDESARTDAQWEPLEAAAYGIVGQYPEDSDAQREAFEESNYLMHLLETATGRLLISGRVTHTEKGLKIVPRKDWPTKRITFLKE